MEISVSKYTFLERLLIWRRMKFSEHKFILFLSFIVGILTAFAGLFLKWFILSSVFFLPVCLSVE